MSLRMQAPTIPKTASFTIDMTATKVGTRFTNRGAAGAIVATLPTPQTGVMSWDGWWCEFFGIADQSITLAAAAGKARTFNNAAATSIAASTGGQKIGANLVARWDAAAGAWHLEGATNGVTITVA